MKTRIVGSRILVAIPMAAVLFTLTGGPALGQRLEKVRFGQVPIASFLAVFIALEKGYFEEESIKPEAHEMAIPHVPPALAAGSLEVGFLGYLAVFMSREQGFDLTIIAPVVTENAVSKPG